MAQEAGQGMNVHEEAFIGLGSAFVDERAHSCIAFAPEKKTARNTRMTLTDNIATLQQH